MRSFGHIRPDGKPSPPKARTVSNLGHSFGGDHKARLIVSLEAGDLIVLRPERTGRSVSITASDLYAYLLRCKANLAHLEKARERKEKKALRLARLRQQRAERNLLK